MRKFILLPLLAILIVAGAYNSTRPLPEGVGVTYDVRQVPDSSVTFLKDITYVNVDGVRQVEQEIFDEIFSMIDGAQRYILADMFLFNDFQSATTEDTRALSRELTDALAQKKIDHPNMTVIVVTDPINTVYGGSPSKHLNELAEAGVQIVMTDLTELRDSNPAYSSFWRVFLRWFGNTDRGGMVPHPFDHDSDNVSVRSYLTLFNLKANHRKLIVADRMDGDSVKMSSLVTSANPHDGSSAHGNIAIRVDDSLWQDVVASEEAVGEFSSDVLDPVSFDVVDREGDISVQLLTEAAIRQRLTELITVTGSGDTIDMAMFYLSDRPIVDALVAAAGRDVAIRLLLDPNKDAFGRVKNGIPNRSVASELLERSSSTIDIRWCDTHGEQCHAKMTLIGNGDDAYMVLGSANLTRRNIGNYNLETNVLVSGASTTTAIRDAYEYFNLLWTNTDKRTFTTDYDTYAEGDVIKKLWYRIGEATGLSTY